MGEISVSYTANRGLISRKYKERRKQKVKKTNHSIKKRTMVGMEEFSVEEIKWLRYISKYSSSFRARKQKFILPVRMGKIKKATISKF